MNEVPDTTEAVVAEVYRNQHVWSAGGDSLAGAIARYAIKAHRKVLSDVGWVEAPKDVSNKAAAWDTYVADMGLSMALLDKFSDHRQSDTGIAVLGAATRLGLLCQRFDLESPF